MSLKRNIAESVAHCPSIIDQKQYWDNRWDQTKTPNGWALRRGETIMMFLRALNLESPKILDLGCGTGWFTEQLSYVGEVTGIDLSETAIAMASSQFPNVRFIAGNLFEMSIPAESFDVVVSQEVIAHVEDQVGYIDRTISILKPRGYLIITTRNKFVIDRLDWDHGPPSHIIQWLDMRTLKQLLSPAFDILRTTTILPMGNRGILRLINSYKVNAAISLLIPRQTVETLKERIGLGFMRILLAQKR